MGALTDRHKKPGGFRKLVNSLETTPFERRAKIIVKMGEEDPVFTSDVVQSIFNFEEFADIEDLVVAEVVGAMKEVKTLAVALHHYDPEIVEKFKRNLQGKQIHQFKYESEMLDKVTKGSQVGCQFKVIEIAREQQNQGKMILKPYCDKYPNDF